MLTKYLQVQLFYFFLIFILPFLISMFYPLNDSKKGNLAAVMSIVCGLLWFFFGKKMIN